MKVLVVDDDTVCRVSLEAMVRTLGHDCATAVDGREAWELLQTQQTDVLITDRDMPYLDGVQLCELLRAELSTRHVYIIVATGFGSLTEAREGMLAGADDYLVKPIALDALRLRMIAAERVITLHRTLEHTNQELRVVARRDALTGLGNRRALTEELAVMANRMSRYQHRFTMALLDIDNFKAFNDRYGHQMGDEALTSVAKVLQSMLRAGDTCYRYGGEEFLCVYPEQSAASARIAVERLRGCVADLAIPHAGGVAGGVLTLSAGIAEMGPNGPDAQQTVRAADTALYAAKRLGRNRVELADLPPRLRSAG